MPDFSSLDPFVTAAQLVAFSEGKLSDTDTRLDGAVRGVSSAIRRYCGWHITPVRDEALTLDGPGGRELALPTMRLRAISEITNRGTSLDVDADLDWSDLGEVELRMGCWSTRYRSVTVSFTHGYEHAYDVEQTALAIANRALSSPAGVTREQAGQVSISYAITSPGVSGGLAVLGPEYAVLDTYRIVSA